MASYRGHLTFSTGLGLAFGGLSWWQLNVDWPVATLGGLFTAVGGLLPDLDSDSGVPVREMANITAALSPLLLLRRISTLGLSPEEVLLAAALTYMFVRFVLFRIFRKITVHRGMYHSIPAMLIAGLITFLAWEHPSTEVRAYFAVGVMLGFLSHLVLDELCSVDLNGVVPKLNQFAGTAVKFYSPSLPATVATYAILAGLGYTTWLDLHGKPRPDLGALVAQNRDDPAPPRKGMSFPERPAKPDQMRWRPFSKRPENVPLTIPGQN